MMRLRRNVILGFVTAGCMAAFAACGSSGNGGATKGPQPEAGVTSSSSPVPRFLLSGAATPPFLDVPFPSDVYLAGGKIVSPLPGLDQQVPRNSSYLSYALGQMNGFSRVALSLFAVDDPAASLEAGAPVSAIIDPSTLPVAEADCTTATSSVYVIDLAPGATTPILPCRAAFHKDPSALTPVVAVGPPRGYLLQEAHQYAAVLTSRVKDTSGHALVASADMAAVAAGGASLGDAGAVGALYTSAYATAASVLKASLATDGATIVAIAPYTTMKKTPELFAMRAALEAAPAPTLAWDSATMAPMGAAKFAKVAGGGGVDGGEDAGGGGALPAGFTASTDALFGIATQKLPDGTDDPDEALPVIAHDQLAAMGTAVFSATSYLQVSAQSYTDPANGTIALDSSGKPVAQAPVKIWITIGIPTSPMPAGGYPVVILEHGLSQSRAGVVPLANVMATQGWAFVAIDLVTFGARAAEATYTTDTKNNFGGPGSTYSGPDGFADLENGSTDFFGNLLDVLAIGDQFRESGLDIAQVVKLIRSNPDLSALQTGATAPAFDPTRIAYVGNSLGGMVGVLAGAIEPSVKAWYDNVAGGSLLPELAAHSPAIGKDLGAAAVLNFAVSDGVYSWSNPLVALIQQAVEPGDPISYAPFLTLSPQTVAGVSGAPRNVLQTSVVWDEVVGIEAQEALARAAGWDWATPNLGSFADISDVEDAGGNLRATPFTPVNPDDAGAVHDTPIPGATAVLVQCSPCEHGGNLLDSQAEDDFGIPYQPPFVVLGAPFTFTENYRAMQLMGVTFIGDAFAGKVPRVTGYPTPVRNR
jgi:dienelactone hydrolase